MRIARHCGKLRPGSLDQLPSCEEMFAIRDVAIIPSAIVFAGVSHAGGFPVDLNAVWKLPGTDSSVFHATPRADGTAQSDWGAGKPRERPPDSEIPVPNVPE